MEGCREPLGKRYSFYVLIETSGSDAEHDMAKLMRFLEGGMASGCLADGEYIHIYIIIFYICIIYILYNVYIYMYIYNVYIHMYIYL
jgi:hypothetical protein